MHKQYEILEALPTYGEMAIPITYSSDLFISEGYVVKFFRNDGTEWIANFELGCTNTSKVVSIKDSDIVVVVAGGQSYIIDPNRTKPLRVLDYYISEIIQLDSGKFIIASDTDILILNKNAELEWESNYIGWDGIRDLKVENNILTGYAYNIFAYEESNSGNDWIRFTVDLDTKEIKGGTFSALDISEKSLGWRYWLIFIFIVGSFQILMHYL